MKVQFTEEQLAIFQDGCVHDDGVYTYMYYPFIVKQNNETKETELLDEKNAIQEIYKILNITE